MKDKLEALIEKGKLNVNSVYTLCMSCHMWGINLPGRHDCGNCNSKDTLTYYDTETVYQIAQKYADQQIDEMWKLLHSIDKHDRIPEGYAGWTEEKGYPSGKTWIGWFLDKYTNSLKQK